MKNRLKNILLLTVMTLFIAIGQFFFKKSSESLSFNLLELIVNYNLWIGFLLYGLGMIIFIHVLKKSDISFAVPFLSLSYVWVFLISYFILKETTTIQIIGGTTLIFLGAIFLGINENRSKIKK